MLLVVGGTGDLGGRVVRGLVERGEEVRCLVRSTADLPGAEQVTGDLTDPASLRKACAGAQTVVATATAIGRRLAGARGPSIRETDELGMLALVEAAEEAGVERFVYVSYAGVDAGLGTPLERAKLAVEDRLRRSALRRVVVRPDAFQELHLGPVGRFDLANGKVAVIGNGAAKHRWVSTDDVAALIVAVSLEPDPPE
ncbi:MAG: NAD(P)H-binding protein, partial [Kribbellaceae bacterium]|nr:NAD(P)H-binding protein [Kribbellaceae bacterium]